MPLGDAVAQFRALHTPGAPFVIPNPWDIGSALMLEGLGFKALATTSSGFAMSRGRRDYGVTRTETVSHAAEIADAVKIPVTGDLENGFGATPEDARRTIEQALTTNMCGGSIEDSTGDNSNPVIADDTLAVERIAAAHDAINESDRDFVLTARAEAFLYGDANINAVITRLNAFAEAGADVLYAPGLPDMDAVRVVCMNVEKPVNVLLHRGLIRETIDAFAQAGASRLSIGGGLAWSAYGTLAGAASMLTEGRFDVLSNNKDGAQKVAPFLKTT